jgi:hypothetical protein
MTRIKPIGAGLLGFIRDDPRLSASSAFSRHPRSIDTFLDVNTHGGG